jgi:superkiller protein 3
LGLICERFGQLDVAVELTERAISILEARYEESEDSETERRYVTANVNVGRLKLATSDFSGALEAFSTALSLSAVSESDVQLHVLRGQMRFGSGLASFKLGELGDALSMFETALEEIPSELKEVRGHVSVLLAQTLWAMGSDEARETAKSQLLEWYVTLLSNNDRDSPRALSSIAVDPSNLAAITTLAAMGTLTFDDSLVDAALSEILAMPLESRLLLDPAKDVDQLLIQHYLNKVCMPQLTWRQLPIPLCRNNPPKHVSSRRKPFMPNQWMHCHVKI